jgi:hypothetical protein
MRRRIIIVVLGIIISLASGIFGIWSFYFKDKKRA